jgi:hypothetical protein
MATQNTFTGIVNDPLHYNAMNPIIQGVQVFVSQPATTIMETTTPRTLDWTLNMHQRLHLNVNTTIVLPAPMGAYYMYLWVYQDAGGGHTLAWPAATRFVADTAPVISVGANAIDLLVVYTDGTSWYVNVIAQALAH